MRLPSLLLLYPFQLLDSANTGRCSSRQIPRDRRELWRLIRAMPPGHSRRGRGPPSISSLSAQDGEALTARKILRVLYRGRYATVRGAGQRLGPDSDGLSGTILQPTSTPSLHPATLPRGFSCAAGDPIGVIGR